LTLKVIFKNALHEPKNEFMLLVFHFV